MSCGVLRDRVMPRPSVKSVLSESDIIMRCLAWCGHVCHSLLTACCVNISSQFLPSLVITNKGVQHTNLRCPFSVKTKNVVYFRLQRLFNVLAVKWFLVTTYRKVFAG